MHTSTMAHDQLFDATVGKDLLIMPAIESSSGTLGGTIPVRKPDGTGWDGRPGLFESYNFAADFPHPDHDGTLAPQLIRQIKDLVKRYITQPATPEWPAKWARMFDRNGNARLAINLIHVGSTKPGLSNAAFGAAFDAVAEQVLADFTIFAAFENFWLSARRKRRLLPSDLASRAVSAGVYPDTSDPHYDACKRRILDMRRAGLIPYSWISDSTRRRLKPSSWSGLADFAETVAQAYRKDLWERQPDYLELFVEKDAMAGVIEPITAAYDVTLNVIRGNCSEAARIVVAKVVDMNRFLDPLPELGDVINERLIW
jgi:hypothetical protein